MSKPIKLVRIAADQPQLGDPQLGPLAEARALADVMNIIAVDGLATGDDTMATLTHMLIDRLAEVRARVDN